MPSLLLLAALLLCGCDKGQVSEAEIRHREILRLIDDIKWDIADCPRRAADHSRVREWLRPDLDLRQRYIGDERWSNIYVAAPVHALHVILPDGRRVSITRAEIDARAKEQ